MAERKWCFDYYHRGAWWGGEVHATSWEEAQEKVLAMGHGKIKGEVMATIKVPRWRWLSRLWQPV